MRLLENGPGKIVVQWRRFKDAERVAKANEAMDPLDPHGITGVIQELLTIYPDGRWTGRFAMPPTPAIRIGSIRDWPPDRA
ncbi:MAG: hypothetical protein K9M97_12795, partial [Akkermansiaceae bacterium]|nr:hypothetical protein [Akkermansiaceae bacterium]